MSNPAACRFRAHKMIAPLLLMSLCGCVRLGWTRSTPETLQSEPGPSGEAAVDEDALLAERERTLELAGSGKVKLDHSAMHRGLGGWLLQLGFHTGVGAATKRSPGVSTMLALDLGLGTCGMSFPIMESMVWPHSPPNAVGCLALGFTGGIGNIPGMDPFARPRYSIEARAFMALQPLVSEVLGLAVGWVREPGTPSQGLIVRLLVGNIVLHFARFQERGLEIMLGIDFEVDLIWLRSAPIETRRCDPTIMKPIEGAPPPCPRKS